MTFCLEEFADLQDVSSALMDVLPSHSCGRDSWRLALEEDIALQLLVRGNLLFRSRSSMPPTPYLDVCKASVPWRDASDSPGEENWVKHATIKAACEDERRAQEVVRRYTVGERRFPEEDLQWLILREVNLSGSDLCDANFGVADLTRANLAGTRLCRANLSYAQLREINLRGADLRWAVLSHSDLSGADLTEADIRGAIFLGALMRGTILKRVHFNEQLNFHNVDLTASICDRKLARRYLHSFASSHVFSEGIGLSGRIFLVVLFLFAALICGAISSAMLTGLLKSVTFVSRWTGNVIEATCTLAVAAFVLWRLFRRREP